MSRKTFVGDVLLVVGSCTTRLGAGGLEPRQPHNRHRTAFQTARAQSIGTASKVRMSSMPCAISCRLYRLVMHAGLDLVEPLARARLPIC